MGVSFSSSSNLQTTNVIGKPYYSGSEAVFNFAVNIGTLTMMRTLGTISNTKLQKIFSNLNIGTPIQT